jgi:succinyl-diaminopimelate desuccinylase
MTTELADPGPGTGNAPDAAAPPDVATLAEALIACPSVTPAAGLVFDCLEAQLAPLGFSVHRFIAGEAPDGPVENLYAVRQGPPGSRHFAFAGHVDVVPPGEGWTSAPFMPERRGELLYGRGAVDMKGAIAAMVSAVATLSAACGTVSLIVTGDEEGPARFGTLALIDHMRAVGQIPDLCLVGEPTCVNRLGDTAKIGRRGSVNLWLEVEGREGHVAYPHLADNPVPRLIALLAELDALVLDEGTAWFQPSNLEITDLTVGNPATNVIPPRASARISIRFNALHTGQQLADRIGEIAARHGGSARAVISGEAFLTEPGEFSRIVADAICIETGIEPALSTTGGTSDARFLKDLCPVIEFGLNNATMHKRDEAVAIEDLATLARIYRRVAEAGLECGPSIATV